MRKLPLTAPSCPVPGARLTRRGELLATAGAVVCTLVAAGLVSVLLTLLRGGR